MSKLREDFAAASELQQLKYCKNYIEEAGRKNKSKNKIVLELKKIGASSELIEDAFWSFEEGDIPGEAEKAMAIAETVLASAKRVRSNTPDMMEMRSFENYASFQGNQESQNRQEALSEGVDSDGALYSGTLAESDMKAKRSKRENEASLLRKIASKLAYQGFGGDVVYETIEKIRAELEPEQDC